MTPGDLAAMHARSITTPRPWTATEFADLLAHDLTFLVAEGQGFALGRVVAGEAELLTLVVAPETRRQGLGSRLLSAFEARSSDLGADRAFLEVAANNIAAITLYERCGFKPTGRRRDYYRSPDGHVLDALVMAKPLRPSAS